MSRLSTEVLLHVAYVKRWHMVRTMREQTLAEHLTLVQIISMNVVDRMPDSASLMPEVLTWALWHDMPEVVTGDLSPPVKRLIGATLPTLVSSIEKNTDERYARLCRETGESAKAIVKFADLVEAIRFIKTEGIGPRAAKIGARLTNELNTFISGVANSLLVELACAMKATQSELL